MDDEHGELLIKRSKKVDAPPPRALLKGSPLDGKAMREALGRLADSVIADGIDGDGPYRAVRDLLLRRSPRIAGRADGAALRRAGETVLPAARRIAVGLPDRDRPAIQGPPGTGKTYTGGRMIVELVRAGRRVGITAQAHKAITNLLHETVEAAREAGVPIRALQRIDDGEAADELAEVTGRRTPRSPGPCRRDGRRRRRDLLAVRPLGARAHASTSCSSTKPASISLANAVAVGTAARAIVLLGDPQSAAPGVARASIPTAPGHRRWSTSSAPSERWRRIAACSCRSPIGCIHG